MEMGSCAQQQESEKGSCKRCGWEIKFLSTVGLEKGQARTLGCYIYTLEAWGVGRGGGVFRIFF